MEWLEYYEALLKNRLITPIWKEVLSLLEGEIENVSGKDDYLVLLSILFSLVDEGNICMSLNKDRLLNKWSEKLEQTKVLLTDLGKFDIESYAKVVFKSNDVIINKLGSLNEKTLPTLIGENKLFIIRDNWLYIKKFDVARNLLLSSIDRLFNKEFDNPSFDYKDSVNKNLPKKFELKQGQENVVLVGLKRNLVITGGPGTGKTTSILFLLLGLLISKQYKEVYLLAPSGKAASRMKDSIKGGLGVLSDDFKTRYKDIIDRIANLKRSTIHSALGIDRETNAFKYNKKHKLLDNSIYIIDEASMIDTCLFASLLSAIPDDARVFIMGDKDQLPSVDAGAVFGDLLVKQSLVKNGNICKLGEAVRFKKGSPVYELANAVNNDDVILPYLPWKNEKLSIQETLDPNENGISEEEQIKRSNPVYYYLNPLDDEKISEKEIIKEAVINFGKEFYSPLQAMCTDIDSTDTKNFDKIFDESVLKASILCAENEGVRGVKTINRIAKSLFIDKTKYTSVDGFYPGELMMINKNNKLLDLSNGDSGILVTFKGDKTLYFMLKKDSELIKNERKIEDKIFKLGGYLFYPFRLITRSEIDDAYAITIHKSQGSDYKNILVILPTKKGHPLLNRQIVYTAITRTKGNTYILSNQDRIKDAKETVVKRDTNID